MRTRRWGSFSRRVQDVRSSRAKAVRVRPSDALRSVPKTPTLAVSSPPEAVALGTAEDTHALPLVARGPEPARLGRDVLLSHHVSVGESVDGGGQVESEQEFADFALSVAPMLHRTAWLLAGDHHLAEDLVQETLARLFVATRKSRPIDNPGGYARTVLVRLHLDARRRKSASEVITDHVPESATEVDHAGSFALRAAMAHLKPEDRAVLVLRYYLDLSVAETARDLRLNPGAVRMRCSRAVAQLRDQLGDFVVPEAPPAPFPERQP